MDETVVNQAVKDFVDMGDDLGRINRLIHRYRSEIEKRIDILRDLETERKKIIDNYMMDKE